MERLSNLPVRSQTAPTKTTAPTATPTKTESLATSNSVPKTESLATSNSVPNITRTDEEGKVREFKVCTML